VLKIQAARKKNKSLTSLAFYMYSCISWKTENEKLKKFFAMFEFFELISGELMDSL